MKRFRPLHLLFIHDSPIKKPALREVGPPLSSARIHYTSVGISTLTLRMRNQVAGHHRASPSATLDKSFSIQLSVLNLPSKTVRVNSFYYSPCCFDQAYHSTPSHRFSLILIPFIPFRHNTPCDYSDRGNHCPFDR